MKPKIDGIPNSELSGADSVWFYNRYIQRWLEQRADFSAGWMPHPEMDWAVSQKRLTAQFVR